MPNKPIVKNNLVQQNSNPLESLKDFGHSTAQNIGTSFKDLGTGMLDQIFGGFQPDKNDSQSQEMSSTQAQEAQEKHADKPKNKANLFNYNEYHETVLVRNEIMRLVESIRKEIQYIRRADKSLMDEVKDIENLSINSLPEKPGIYHIRFLEIVLRTLQLMRQKMGESKTWMQALQSKKKKRGSLFVVQSKKAGTQFSQSQELSNARSVQ